MGNMMECLPSGGWFSLGLRPRENHPPSGKHSVMLPTLAWHICIMLHAAITTSCPGDTLNCFNIISIVSVYCCPLVDHYTVSLPWGPAQMAEWSKALPLTASCLSPCMGSNPSWGNFEEATSYLGLGGGFSWVLRFPPPLTIG